MAKGKVPHDPGILGQNRLPSRDGEQIDRSSAISFTFGGRRYGAYAGDTIASALTAAGVDVISRSFKYHRARGLLCCSGHCPNCLVQVGADPNVRACQREVEDGMDVQPQNAWPSLKLDLLSLTGLADRFLPVGFYYKTFIRPRWMWPVFEKVLRLAAGLGRVDADTPWETHEKQYLHADVVVVGGGPAGVNAALAAAESGAKVRLFEENPDLGGHLRFTGDAAEVRALRERAEKQSNLQLHTRTTVVGWYRDHWLSAVRDNRLYKIRTGSVVLATGAYERPLLFENNDLPGIMLGSAVSRLVRFFGVAPGKRAVVVAANADGWGVAEELARSGVSIGGIVDPRADGCGTQIPEILGGVSVFRGYTVVAATGKSRVCGVVIAPVGQLSQQQRIACDLVSVSTGWTPVADLAYMAGSRSAYDMEHGQMRVAEPASGIFLAGRVNGAYEVEIETAEGRVAGLSAAAFCRYSTPPTEAELHVLEERNQRQPANSWDEIVPAGSSKGKRFVCYCEDVTETDVTMALAEGYDSMELLKRYSTISMGPCQGKMCSMNALQLCAQIKEQTADETGRTTSRPPVVPVSLGALTGQAMEPVQITPVHEWHRDRGAKFMVAGLWLRPEHYGDPTSEIMTVRERVGLIDVSTLGKIKLTGPGVANLLERVYVNQWRKLGVGRVRYGVMCNDEGVVLDDGVCAHVSEHEWYMSTTTSGAGAIFQWLEWWAQSGWGEGVHLTNLTEEYSAFNLSGPHARRVLQKLTERDLSNEKVPYMRARSATVADAPCRLLRIGFTGELSYEVHCASAYAQQVWDALLEAGQEFDIAPFGIEAQRVLRLEKAHIIVGQDTDAMSDPLSADMEWAVKLGKSDFLGKRELVRLAETGGSQRLVGFRMEASAKPPEEGLQIVSTGNSGLEIIGWVTSSRFSPSLQQPIGLCWLPVRLAEQENRQIHIFRDGQLLDARVHHGPFYDPEGSRLKM